MKLHFPPSKFTQPSRWILVFLLVAALSITLASVAPVLAACDPNAAVTRVSVASDGTQADSFPFADIEPVISGEGRYVVFESTATTLVSNDNNGKSDIFLHDRQTCQTSRISMAADDGETNGDSYRPGISPNGRWIVFSSKASNVVANDTNNALDTFLFVRQTEQMTRISVASDGSQANNQPNITLIGIGPQGEQISSDGRFVLFSSEATNLVANDTNNILDVFIRDTQLSQTTRVSVATDGSQANGGSGANSISQDGRYIVFQSTANNLVAGDSNNLPDIFVRDLQLGQTSLISVASDGTQTNQISENATISNDGRYVAFGSVASNLVTGDTNNIIDTFVRDRQIGQTVRISVSSTGTQANGNFAGFVPHISANGRYVIFTSDSSNLVDNDTNGKPDVFMFDRLTAQTKRVSLAGDGGQGNGGINIADISDNGSLVVFSSTAPNLVSDDTNNIYDVFVAQISLDSTFTVNSN
ncbi:MAG: hypothetical protein ABI690_28235 [Chloroflexota bacterium]